MTLLTCIKIRGLRATWMVGIALLLAAIAAVPNRAISQTDQNAAQGVGAPWATSIESIGAGLNRAGVIEKAATPPTSANPAAALQRAPSGAAPTGPAPSQAPSPVPVQSVPSPDAPPIRTLQAAPFNVQTGTTEPAQPKTVGDKNTGTGQAENVGQTQSSSSTPSTGPTPTTGPPPSTSPTQTTGPIQTATPDWAWGSEIIAAGAAAEIVQTHQSKVVSWTKQLEAAEKSIAFEGTTDQQLRDIPARLEKTREQIAEFIASIKPKLSETRARFKRLGPAPKDGEPTGTDALEGQRKTLGQEVAAYEGLTKHAEVQSLKAQQLIVTANAVRRDRFTRRLLKPSPMVFAKDAWLRAASSIPSLAHKVSDDLSASIAKVGWPAILVAIVPVLLYLFSRFAIRREVHKFPRRRDNTPQTVPYCGALEVIKNAMVHVAPAWIFLGALFAVGLLVGLIQPTCINFFALAGANIASALLLMALVVHSSNPNAPYWPKLISSFRAWSRFRMLAWALIITWAFDQVLMEAYRFLDAPLALAIVSNAALGAIYAVLLFALFLVNFEAQRSDTKQRFRGWHPVAFLGLAVSITMIAVASVMSFANLARFMGGQIVATGGILYVMYLVHMASEYISVQSKGGDADAEPSGLLRVSVGLLLDAAILLVGVPALLVQWGFDWIEVAGWIRTAFFGFEIGGLSLSLQSIVVALSILIFGVLLTRIVRRWLMHRLELTGRFQNGTRHSISAGLGYSGFMVSTLAAASSLGIDFTNLAIVAGAISVGIGFGMQSIFNNFISGLILLAERPIKIGDWISVGTKEGFVRKINVRATEIETIDRQSVIVPNSELISGSVTNWMHADNVGRAVVNVGVGYNSDSEQVSEILLQIAKQHPDVLQLPEPSVIFSGFGESALDFELRVFVGNVGARVKIASDLRHHILKALRESAIEIPFPQRDLHIRDARALQPAVQSEHDVPTQPQDILLRARND